MKYYSGSPLPSLEQLELAIGRTGKIPSGPVLQKAVLGYVWDSKTKLGRFWNNLTTHGVAVVAGFLNLILVPITDQWSQFAPGLELEQLEPAFKLFLS